MRTCSVCSSSNPDEAKFCFKCGSSLSTSTAVAGQAPTLAFLTLSCPSCGSSLKVDPEQQRADCPNCGTRHLVMSGGGIVTLQAVQQVAASTEKLYKTTSHIEQNVTGMGSDFISQSSTFKQQSVSAGLTQEMINVRRELGILQNQLRGLPTVGSMFIILVVAIVFYVFYYSRLSGGDIPSYLAPLMIFMGFCWLLSVIVIGTSRSKIKKKIEPLERRLHELEQMLRNQGG